MDFSRGFFVFFFCFFITISLREWQKGRVFAASVRFLFDSLLFEINVKHTTLAIRLKSPNNSNHSYGQVCVSELKNQLGILSAYSEFPSADLTS